MKDQDAQEDHHIPGNCRNRQPGGQVPPHGEEDKGRDQQGLVGQRVKVGSKPAFLIEQLLSSKGVDTTIPKDLKPLKRSRGSA